MFVVVTTNQPTTMQRTVGSKIVAIGKNYVAHSVEMGQAKPPSKPMYFLKPLSSIIRQGESIRVPPGVSEVHHEVELGVVMGKPCTAVSEASAMSCVAGYVLALDMTARDEQSKAKKAGKPWTQSKGYDTFCPISEFIPADKVDDPNDLDLWLKVDGKLRQKGNTKDMIFNVPYLIHYVSSRMSLDYGDIILTGTPEGVGPVSAGQVIEAGLADLTTMSFPVAPWATAKL